MPEWLKNIPDNYTAQLAIMGWFLTITSKMTGYTIPGVGVAPGGIIEQPRDAIAHYLMDMETLADAMAVKKSWDRPQYAILKEMYLDLKRMHYSFRVNRSWSHNKPTSDISTSVCSGTRRLVSSGQWTGMRPAPRKARGRTLDTETMELDMDTVELDMMDNMELGMDTTELDTSTTTRAPSSLPRGATGGTSPTPRRSLRRRLGRKTKTTRRRSCDPFRDPDIVQLLFVSNIFVLEREINW